MCCARHLFFPWALIHSSCFPLTVHWLHSQRFRVSTYSNSIDSQIVILSIFCHPEFQWSLKPSNSQNQCKSLAATFDFALPSTHFQELICWKLVELLSNESMLHPVEFFIPQQGDMKLFSLQTICHWRKHAFTWTPFLETRECLSAHLVELNKFQTPKLDCKWNSSYVLLGTDLLFLIVFFSRGLFYITMYINLHACRHFICLTC